MTALDTLYKVALWVAALGLAAWGLLLVFIPEQVHPVGNANPINPATTATLGAALVALAVLLLFVALQQATELALAVAVAVVILALMRAYLMFMAGSVILNTTMLVTFAIGVVAAVILLIGAVAQPASTKTK